jgi:diguanylate cyclase (GGDEF)-like protein
VASSLQGLNVAQRPGDLIARYGGEEFVVVLSGGDFTYAQRIAKSIHKRLQLLNVRHAYSAVEGVERVSMSIGLATADRICSHLPQGLLHQADAALYQAKHEGRNRTCVQRQSADESIT